uniref:U3 small nucleolar RNA-associated protein 11 n=1 Tax=Araucaria cunninghamii TaxID=56994 RepID=A0A0D6QXT8_ARACU
MSSLRNAVKRWTHKERAQPAERSRFGLLEKHKDYVLRARDFHKKEETIRKLQEKAAFRNPDEFYFKMINTRTVDGVHRPQSLGKTYSTEEALLMKTQDIGYMAQKAQSEKKKVERLSSVLHYIDNPPSNKHIYFAENREEAKELEPLVRSSEEKAVVPSNLPSRIKKKTASAYKELEERKRRANEMQNMVMEMNLRKELMGKGRKRKLRDDEIVVPTSGPVYKWRRERKR